MLLSTLHNDVSIDKDKRDQQKLEIITFYNQTIYGFDRLDQMCSLWFFKKFSLLSTYSIFNIISIWCINSLYLYAFNNIDKRTIFFILQPMKPNIEKRY